MQDKKSLWSGFADFRFLKVTFFASLVLLLETVLFNVLLFIYDYFIASLGLGFVIIGIALGAFAASKKDISEKSIFTLACIGTTIFIYISTFTIVYSYPLYWVGALALALGFFFPVFYISTIFKNHRSSRVYLFDMLGAFLGVVFTVVTYSFLQTELIIFLLTWLIPLIGLIIYLFNGWKNMKKYVLIIYLLLIGIGVFFFIKQHRTDAYNLHLLMQAQEKDAPCFELQKAFRKEYRFKTLVKTYDTLRGRLDVFTMSGGRTHQVAYTGVINDHFTVNQAREYETFFKPRDITWPSDDIRVLYGLVDEPKICIIGAAAQGIIKTIKEITPLDNITPLEINPAIIQIMTEDYYEESGKAYKGLKPVVGNAISLLKSSKDKFDIITMINTHSSRTIAYPGPPNHLHTIETYDMFFNHLTDKGYILLEERPITLNGQLAFYRQLNTFWQCLKDRGAKDPSDHFVIWEWMSRGYGPIKKYNDGYYISMIVTKEPIDKKSWKTIKSWLRLAIRNRNRKGAATELLYFKGHKEDWEIKQIFEMIKMGRLDLVTVGSIDPTVVTNDRPFMQMGSSYQPRLVQLLLFGGIIASILWIISTFGMLSGSHARTAWMLNGYNVFTGMAYFLIEIMLLQIYQNIYSTAASSLVFVLGVLLLSSGIGGLFSEKLNTHKTTIMLIPICCIAVFAPGLLLKWAVPFYLIKIISILLVGITGFFMGFYFPKGLIVAKDHGLQHKIPYLFAINCIGGSFAVVLALWLGVKIGYMLTVIIAIILYILAGILLSKLQKTDEQAKTAS